MKHHLIRVSAAGGAVLALAILAGCSSNGPEAASTLAPSATKGSESLASSSMSPEIFEQDPRIAMRAAKAKVTNAEIVQITDGSEAGRATLTFTMRRANGSSKDVIMDLVDSEVIRVEPGMTPKLVLKGPPNVSADDALDYAFARVSHAQIHELQLIDNGGQLKWSITLDSSTGEHHFEISADKSS